MNAAACYPLFTDFKSPKDPAKSPFYWTDLIRTYFIFVGAFTLPAFVTERFCAVLLVSDYEQNTRSYISLILTIVTNALGALFTWISYYDSGLKVIVGVVISANIVALLVSAYCDRRSIKYYKKCAKVEPKNGNILYSLSERFQCAENVRIAKMLRMLILFTGALNLALGGVYILRMAKAEYILPLYINCELFDSAIALYAILVPMIVYRRSKIFRTKMKALPAKCVRYIICIKPADRHKAQEEQRSSSETVIHPMGGSRIQLENVLGVKLTQISSYHETEVYFEQLLRSWNPKSKVPEIVKKAQLEKIDAKRKT
ncbi:sre G protein-coupled chemoreceptor domain-containing protein [Ditylenchus destructor]|uniref:Sre G protein-coupled chemoreceptor domain-containing protein n=1 Tax=Ditylenchus destructor TaxID=166010 RepID=A0AAD4MU96_9BILA|nr:sre G protein-coupled chemoreceptor domain-containing protein [Ditylenchus destructor]